MILVCGPAHKSGSSNRQIKISINVSLRFPFCPLPPLSLSLYHILVAVYENTRGGSVYANGRRLPVYLPRPLGILYYVPRTRGGALSCDGVYSRWSRICVRNPRLTRHHPLDIFTARIPLDWCALNTFTGTESLAGPLGY